MTEDYVSFPVAKLLKEKGFDIITSKWIERTDKGMEKYGPNANKIFIGWNCGFEKDDEFFIFYPRPTHALAVKWLRIKHNIHIWDSPIVNKDGIVYSSGICWIEGDFVKRHFIGTQPLSDLYFNEIYNTPEEAIEAGLLYALQNLVK